MAIGPVLGHFLTSWRFWCIGSSLYLFLFFLRHSRMFMKFWNMVRDDMRVTFFSIAHPSA